MTSSVAPAGGRLLAPKKSRAKKDFELASVVGRSPR